MFECAADPGVNLAVVLERLVRVLGYFAFYALYKHVAKLKSK